MQKDRRDNLGLQVLGGSALYYLSRLTVSNKRITEKIRGVARTGAGAYNASAFYGRHVVTFTRSCLLAPGALFAVLCTAVDAADNEPDLREVAGAGQQSLRRLGTAVASWTTVIERSGGGKIAVAVLSAPGRRRMVVTIAARGQRFEVIRLIIRDGAWYATEKEGIRGKYRPYEAPFNIPAAYAFITWAEPHFVIGTDDAGLGKYEGTRPSPSPASINSKPR